MTDLKRMHTKQMVDAYKTHRGFLTLSLLLILIFLSSGIAIAEAQPDSEKAWETVKSNILKSGLSNKVIFRSKEPLKGGQEIKCWDRIIKVPAHFEQAWFFFVDDQPMANWGHKCRYIFVDTKTYKYHVIDSTSPPNSLDDMYQIYPPPD